MKGLSPKVGGRSSLKKRPSQCFTTAQRRHGWKELCFLTGKRKGGQKEGKGSKIAKVRVK